ncbi:hypothetical protein JW887_05865 [Candidatus Dojkabacteria bacterium]|nr:hypothetical protein [Candidatus Dojkabacteria bacterium]
MDGNGLAKPKKVSDKVTQSKFWFFTSIILLLIFLGLIYVNREDLKVFLPGYYQNDEYQDLTDKKNKLIDENEQYLSQRDELNDQLLDLGYQPADFDQKVSIYNDILDKLTLIENNLKKIVDYDDQMLDLRVPSYVVTYLNLVEKGDKTRLEIVQKNKDIISANIDQAKLDKIFAEFNICTENAGKQTNDAVVASELKTCMASISSLRTLVGEMESTYDVKLTNLSTYIDLFDKQWQETIAFREAVNNGDYASANAHDDAASQLKRDIQELGEVESLGEFSNTVIKEYIDDLSSLLEDETRFDNEAQKCYELNFEKEE